MTWEPIDADEAMRARITDELTAIHSHMGDEAPALDAEVSVQVNKAGDIHFITDTDVYMLTGAVAMRYRVERDGTEDVSYWRNGVKIGHIVNAPDPVNDVTVLGRDVTWEPVDADEAMRARMKDELTAIWSHMGDEAPPVETVVSVQVNNAGDIQFITDTDIYMLTGVVAMSYRVERDGTEDVSYWSNGVKIGHIVNPPDPVND